MRGPVRPPPDLVQQLPDRPVVGDRWRGLTLRKWQRSCVSVVNTPRRLMSGNTAFRGTSWNPSASDPRSPAAERFAAHVLAAFEALKHLIKRHENAVVWGR